MTERDELFDRLVAIWNGELDLAKLDSLVAPGYVGHIGSRVRDSAQLKLDISDYRAQTPGVVFSVQHQFGEDDSLATRLEACAPGAQEQAITGINVSRWHDDSWSKSGPSGSVSGTPETFGVRAATLPSPPFE